MEPESTPVDRAELRVPHLVFRAAARAAKPSAVPAAMQVGETGGGGMGGGSRHMGRRWQFAWTSQQHEWLHDAER